VDGESITGGTSGATATCSGTGTDEDIMLKLTTTSDTFNTLALTFLRYAITIDASMLDVANGFNHFQLLMGDAGSSETQACAIFIPRDMKISKYPAASLIGAQKID